MSLVTFDFDGTIVDGDAGVLFARHLLVRGYLEALTDGPVGSRLGRLAELNWNTARLAAKHVSLHARYRLGDVDRRGMVARGYAGFAGHDRETVEAEMTRFARNKLPAHTRDEVVRQLEHHVERGDHVVVLSTGPHALIWPLRQELDLDFEVVACRLRGRDGELTGEVEGPLDGSQKATRMVAIARRREHDLAEAYAYADHEDDEPVLDLVGNPVVVHPTSRMRALARQRGWPILWDA